MKNSIQNSLSKLKEIESRKSLTEAAASPAATGATTTGGKILGKVLPGAGAAFGAYDAAQRAKMGDTTGAAIAGATGAASLVPGLGAAASLVGTGIQAARDKWRTGSWFPSDEEITAAVAKDATPTQPTAQQPTQQTDAPAATPALRPGANPKIAQLQQRLVAKGAKIKVDGFMGPKTQMAMQQFPDVQLASKVNKIKGTIMSESQRIAALRERLAQIESGQINEANPMQAGKAVAPYVAKGVEKAGDYASKAKSAVSQFFQQPGMKDIGGRSIANDPLQRGAALSAPGTSVAAKTVPAATAATAAPSQFGAKALGGAAAAGATALAANELAKGREPQPGAAPTGAAAKPAGKWPTTRQEIEAFQKANGLPVDGKIGKNTYIALTTKGGLTPPAGFVPVADKAKPASKPAGGSVAAPSTQTGGVAGLTAQTQPQMSTAPASATETPPTSAPAATVDPNEMAELDALATEFKDFDDPEVQQLLAQYNQYKISKT